MNKKKREERKMDTLPKAPISGSARDILRLLKAIDKGRQGIRHRLKYLDSFTDVD